jgi:hypothetical protein
MTLFKFWLDKKKRWHITPNITTIVVIGIHVKCFICETYNLNHLPSCQILPRPLLSFGQISTKFFQGPHQASSKGSFFWLWYVIFSSCQIKNIHYIYNMSSKLEETLIHVFVCFGMFLLCDLFYFSPWWNFNKGGVGRCVLGLTRWIHGLCPWYLGNMSLVLVQFLWHYWATNLGTHLHCKWTILLHPKQN